MSKASEKPEKPDKDSELGTLIVVLLKARNLNDKHSFRKQDVFAQATLNNVQKRSHVDPRGGQHPEWDSEVRFTVLKGNGPGGKNRKLEVACYCQEPKTEDLLGRATVDISNTLKTGEFDDWVSLDIDGVVRGDIYLEMTYYAKTPAPAAPKNKLLAPAQGSALGRRPSKLTPSERLSRPIQQNFPGPSRFPPKQPSPLQTRIDPTSSHLNNSLSPRKNTSLLALLRDEPLHASPTLPNTQNRSSLSPQAIQRQPLEPPSILRPGLGGHSSSISAPALDPQDFVRIRNSADSSNNRAYGMDSVSQLNPYIGGSSTYTPALTGLSNNVGTSSYPYAGGGLHLPESQLGLNVPSYPPAPSPVQTTRPSSFDYSAPANPYTGVNTAFIPGSQQAPDRQVYSSPPPVDPVQTLGYANYVTSQQVPNGASLSYSNAGTEASGSVSSAAFAFPMPTVMEPYGYSDPSPYKSSHYQPPPPPPPPRTSSVDNNRRSEQELDPYYLARYQTPLPLPPGSIKESPFPPLPPLPPPPPPPPTIATPSQVSSPPPKVATLAPVPDATRVEVLRKVEEAAAWRKEQELKDLELAMQLDRELNL